MATYEHEVIGIIVDDFSYRAYDYPNVHIYDYADLTYEYHYDDYLMNVDIYSPSYGQKIDFGNQSNIYQI